MLTAIIVDDEKKIIQLIRQLVDWDRLGVTVIGEAYDGLDAFEMILNRKPDILITDICMPGIDGLELAKRSSEQGLNVSIVVISGYKQFEYAYSALKYGVEDFLIKPINREEINNVLNKVCTKLRMGKCKQDDEQTMKLRLNKSTAKTRKLFLEERLNDLQYTGNLLDLNNEYFFHFDTGVFIGIALQFESLGEVNDNISAILNKAERIVLNCFSGISADMESYIRKDSILFLVNLHVLDENKFSRQIRKCYETLYTELEIYGGIHFTIGLGHMYAQPARITDTLTEAGKAVRCKCVLGMSRIITADEAFISEPTEKLDEKEHVQLAALAEAYKIDEIKKWINEIFTKKCKDDSRPWRAVSLYMAICDEVKLICQANSIDVVEILWEKLYAGLDNSNSLDKLKTALSEGIRIIMSVSFQEKQHRDNYPIRCAKEYMQNHLNEQISLDDIASAVSLSCGYLSSMFSKETGTNVSEFLLELRITKAKMLLKTTLLNLSEISEQVGYKDPKHFSKLFAKTVGIRPQEYRKLYGH